MYEKFVIYIFIGYLLAPVTPFSNIQINYSLVYSAIPDVVLNVQGYLSPLPSPKIDVSIYDASAAFNSINNQGLGVSATSLFI